MNKFLSFISDRIYTFLLISFFVVILHKKTNVAKSVLFFVEIQVGIDPTARRHAAESLFRKMLNIQTQKFMRWVL